MVPRKRLHLHPRSVSDVNTSPSLKKTRVYRRRPPHPPCRSGHQSHIFHLPTTPINFKPKKSKNIHARPLDSLVTFQIFFANFMRWISGTMVSVVPPSSRIEPKSCNKSDSSGVFTFGVRFRCQYMRSWYI